MSATVSLSLLNRCLIDARRMVTMAMDSKDAEPTLNFSAVRASLRKALELLGDQRTVGDATPVKRSAVRVDVNSIFRKVHPHANHGSDE
jgi:hypothetical protein